MAYHEKLETSRRFIRDATMVHPMAVMMFGGAIQVVIQWSYTGHTLVISLGGATQ